MCVFVVNKGERVFVSKGTYKTHHTAPVVIQVSACSLAKITKRHVIGLKGRDAYAQLHVGYGHASPMECVNVFY
jgi:hypothetical protein